MNRRNFISLLAIIAAILTGYIAHPAGTAPFRDLQIVSATSQPVVEFKGSGDVTIWSEDGKQLVRITPKGEVTLSGDPKSAAFWASITKVITDVSRDAEQRRKARCENGAREL